MQTCSRCHEQSPDSADDCISCHADLQEFSTTAVSLKQLVDNPRVLKIRINVWDDACPSCQAAQGTYEKTGVPHLPHAGCSHENGCRCSYEPVLDFLFP
jgi:hypothetical protein